MSESNANVVRGKKTKITALLFDLGGVVMDIDFNQAFITWVGMSDCDAAALASRFSFDVGYQRHELGELTGEQYFQGLMSTLGMTIHYQQFIEGWSAIFNGVSPEITNILSLMAPRYPIYALSNTNHLHHLGWANKYADTLQYFERLFLSYEMGMRKPERRVFDHVAQQMGVSHQQVLFFDDTIENVDVARELGMTAVHVRSVADVENAIAQFC